MKKVFNMLCWTPFLYKFIKRPAKPADGRRRIGNVYFAESVVCAGAAASCPAAGNACGIRFSLLSSDCSSALSTPLLLDEMLADGMVIVAIRLSTTMEIASPQVNFSRKSAV